MLFRHLVKSKDNLNLDYHSRVEHNKLIDLNMNVILLVGMADSPHFAKWLQTTRQEFPGRKILIYPSDRPRFKDTRILLRKKNRSKDLVVFHLIPFKKLNFAFYFLLDNLIGIRWRSYFLARLIMKNKPGIIHFHEMQHGAYIYNYISNYSKIPSNSKKIISTWGSDLTLYSWAAQHSHQIKACLSWADIITAERQEELVDAQRLGFTGDFRAPVYITIGQNSSELKVQIKPSMRKTILVKGHQSDTGRALNVLQAISQLSSQLNEFEILVYSAPNAVQIQVDTLRNKHKINIRALPKVSHGEMCSLFYNARVSISVAISDGLPGVLVEAMQAGAFPIQSKNSAGKDFIVDGKNGFLVDPWDIESIKDSINASITDGLLVDQASTLNLRILQEKYSLKIGVEKLKELYL